MTRALRLRAWWTVLGVYLQDNLAYRSQAVIWMLADAVPALVLPNLWLAGFQGRETIRGFTPSGLVWYYLVSLCLANVATSHVMWDIAREIQDGRFSAFLTRPFPYAAYQYAGNLSWRLMRAAFFVPILLLGLFLFRNVLRWEAYDLGPWFLFAALGGHVLSFLIAYSLGLLALFFTETRGIYLFYYLPMGFLSGELVPLAMLPDWARSLAHLLPFRYTLAFPAEIFLRRLGVQELLHGFLLQAVWVVLIGLAAGWLWRRGLRHYTGVGM